MPPAPKAPEGKKWVLVPKDAYGYRVKYWHNQMENMPESAVSDYRTCNMYIIDDVLRGPDIETGLGSASSNQHEYLCNEVHNLGTTTFTDCTVHSVRMKAGQREEDFVDYIEDELEQYGPNDLVIFYFHGKTGEKDSKYTWRFRGPGPKHINAYDFINQVNRSNADCYFILDCFIPTNFPKCWERTDHMTEFSIASHQMRDDRGRPINGPENFTETLCRSMRRFANNVGKRKRPSLHHIIARDRIKVSHPLRLWTVRPDRTKREQGVWRFFVDAVRYKENGRLQMRRCNVTIRRPGDGEFDEIEDDEDDGEDDEHDGEAGDGPRGGGSGGPGGGRDDDDDDGGDDSGLGGGSNDGNDADGGDDYQEDPLLGLDDEDINDDNGASNNDENDSARLRELSRQLQAGKKRKGDDRQGSSSATSKRSKRSSSGSASKNSVASGNQNNTPIALDDDDEGDDSLFISQSQDPSSAGKSLGRVEREEPVVVDNNTVDQDVIDLIEDNIAVAMSSTPESSISGPSKDKQPILPRLGGFLKTEPSNGAESSSQMPDELNTPVSVVALPTSAHGARAQALEDRFSRSIKQSSSPAAGAGCGSRLDSATLIKRERSSSFPENRGTSRLASASSIKRELPDDDEDDDLVITGFSAKVILPTANGEMVDLTLDD